MVHAVPRLPVGAADAYAGEAAGDPLLVEGEVLAAHDRIHAADVIGADEAFGRAARDGPRRLVVDGRRIIRHQRRHRRVAPVCRGDTTGDLPDAALDAGETLAGQAAEGPGQPDLFRDHVHRIAAVDRSDGNDGRIEWIHLA